MKKSFFQSLILHLVLIALFYALPLTVHLLKKGKHKQQAIELTFESIHEISEKTPSKEQNKPIVKPTQTPPEDEKSILEKAVEVPEKITPPAQPAVETPPPMPSESMQKAALIQPESSPEVYGSMSLNAYYYNKPMEAFPSLVTTKSPSKKAPQPYSAKPSMFGNSIVPIQKTSTTHAETNATIILSITVENSTRSIPVDKVPTTIPIIIKSDGDTTLIVKEKYLKEIQQTIEKYKIYPEDAKVSDHTARTLTVQFRITKDGTIINIVLLKSSGSDVLDADGIALLKKCEPFQPIPDVFKKNFIDIILEINYK